MPHILHGKKSSVGCAIWPSISNQLGNNSLFDMYGGPEKGLLVGEIEERLRPSSRTSWGGGRPGCWAGHLPGRW